ncbi:MAG: hypothetical protein GY775_18595 [Candidatus Scalindua sp.]|nr:hypothetical protein [Candidatus Scalindua sp.]
MSKIYFVVLVAILTVISTKTVNGAELHGKFSYGGKLTEFTVDVKCGDWSREKLPIAGNGKIYVRGLPGNRNCYLTVDHSGYKRSPRVLFSTRSSVVSIVATLKIRNGQIIVLSR